MTEQDDLEAMRQELEQHGYMHVFHHIGTSDLVGKVCTATCTMVCMAVILAIPLAFAIHIAYHLAIIGWQIIN